MYFSIPVCSRNCHHQTCRGSPLPQLLSSLGPKFSSSQVLQAQEFSSRHCWQSCHCWEREGPCEVVWSKQHRGGIWQVLDSRILFFFFFCLCSLFLFEGKGSFCNNSSLVAMLFLSFCSLLPCVVRRGGLAFHFACLSDCVVVYGGAILGEGLLHHFVFLCSWRVHENSAPLYQVNITVIFACCCFIF